MIARVRPVSLILTVKNEAAALPRLIDSLRAQTVPPFQIVVADGGSTDATRTILNRHAKELNLSVIDCPGTNISQGRNAAIAYAQGELIASTDAGVRLDPHWLEEIVKPFDSAQPADVVSGFFEPDPQGAFEYALAAATLPELRDIRPDHFLPSSRSIAFRKSAWEKVGGYPEWLDYSEDLIFDFALQKSGFRFVFAPSARVFFRPRPNLTKFFRQYYLYARGDGKADLWLKRHLLRFATYLVALPLSLLIFTRVPLFALIIWFLGAIVLFGTPYRRLLRLWHPLTSIEKMAALVWVPIIRVAGDVAKMFGYCAGVIWRMNNGSRRKPLDRGIVE